MADATQQLTAYSCPAWLGELLSRHRDLYEPDYSGSLSDHLPMMLLAMHGLGMSRDVIEKRNTRYVRRLDLAPKREITPIERLEQGLGRRKAYRALLGFFDAEIEKNGVAGTLEAHLPTIISGWVRHAFHGTIRLAYGIRFGVQSEVAAGLSYLASAGPDEELARVGEMATPAEKFVWPPALEIGSSGFNRRYAEVKQSNTWHAHLHVIPNNSTRVAEESLGLFNHTQDFFALHMVTGTHALGICADAAQLSVDKLMNAGLAAAYLAVDAPAFVVDAKPKSLNMDYAHEVKVAFSCFDQAKRLNSAPFREAADIYTTPFV